MALQCVNIGFLVNSNFFERDDDRGKTKITCRRVASWQTVGLNFVDRDRELLWWTLFIHQPLSRWYHLFAYFSIWNEFLHATRHMCAVCPTNLCIHNWCVERLCKTTLHAIESYGAKLSLIAQPTRMLPSRNKLKTRLSKMLTTQCLWHFATLVEIWLNIFSGIRIFLKKFAIIDCFIWF